MKQPTPSDFIAVSLFGVNLSGSSVTTTACSDRFFHPNTPGPEGHR